MVALSAPVQAQTTGTIQTWLGVGVTMPTSVVINSNHEWEVNYTLDLGTETATGTALFNAKSQCDIVRPLPDCTMESPYIFRYGVVSDHTSCGVNTAQSDLNGINGRMPLGSWQQTLRTRPNTSYCFAVYAGNSGSYFYNRPITSAGFRTPADPSPPAPVQTGYFTGCFAHPTLSYAACVTARNACNNDSSTNWDNDRNQCRPATN